MQKAFLHSLHVEVYTFWIIVAMPTRLPKQGVVYTFKLLKLSVFTKYFINLTRLACYIFGVSEF